ncbi:MAG: transporter [Gemmataceae bacterium]|nr:transporter [Gemmataceae bacterium]
MASDRPDFTEASSTVGKGRVQLEAGYTFATDRSGGVTTTSHSYPEALLRVGLFADWFEFRIGQTFGTLRTGPPGTPSASLPVAPTDTSSDPSPLSGTFSAGGAEDLYLGAKLGLTEQKGVLPELALIIQSQVPTGHRDFTAGRVLPGLNLLYGWDVIEDRISLAGSSQGNRAIDADRHGYVELAQSLSVGYTLTGRLGAYTEWFAFYPAGATAEGVTAQHYANGGFTHKVTPNFQLDVRAGVGLSRNADDFFAGTGFAVRY